MNAPVLPEVLLHADPTPQPPALIAEDKTVLALGSRQRFADFLAFYLLHCIHGEQLLAVYLDENTDQPPTYPNKVYTRCYTLNASSDDPAWDAGQAQLLIHVNTGSKLLNEVSHLVAEQSDRTVLVQQESRRIISYRDCGTPGRQEPFPTSSALLHTLIYTLKNLWFREGSSTLIPLSVFFKKPDVELERLSGVLQLVESLPSYANRSAYKLHELLDALPHTFEAMDEFLTKPFPL